MNEIIDVLMKLQKGYDEKIPDNAPALMANIFSNRQDHLTFGTGTNELCFSRDEVMELIRSDWDGGWGDFKMDIPNAVIEVDGDVAWFFADCTVKYHYEDTQENYAYFAETAYEYATNEKATPKQRLSHINWVLGLRFHQRTDGKREYLLRAEFSGMLIKEGGSWKIVAMHFATPKPDYPDSRFEDTNRDYTSEYKSQKSKFDNYPQNVANDKIVELINGIESSLSFERQQVRVLEYGDFMWVMTVGVQKKVISEDEVLNGSLQDIKRLHESDLPSDEMLYLMKRSTMYALKEISSGSEFTWQVRVSAIVEKKKDGYVIRHKHLSYPCDWIIEGKL